MTLHRYSVTFKVKVQRHLPDDKSMHNPDYNPFSPEYTARKEEVVVEVDASSSDDAVETVQAKLRQMLEENPTLPSQPSCPDLASCGHYISPGAKACDHDCGGT
jgi:hypothetical protein